MNSKGKGDGSGSGWGSGDGSGRGWGSGDGSGRGSKEARLKIELQILSTIPNSDLPLWINCWEFDETQVKFENMLKGVTA
jgi:hypothetical protein